MDVVSGEWVSGDELKSGEEACGWETGSRWGRGEKKVRLTLLDQSTV
jgi:hypothetical protein